MRPGVIWVFIVRVVVDLEAHPVEDLHAEPGPLVLLREGRLVLLHGDDELLGLLVAFLSAGFEVAQMESVLKNIGSISLHQLLRSRSAIGKDVNSHIENLKYVFLKYT